MAKDQDKIGWQQCMEGMISHQMRQTQQQHHIHFGTKTSPEQWAKGLVLKLLKATHGQWLYCNLQIHNKKSGSLATTQKEAIQKEIKEQMDLRAAGLLDEDLWMMEVNLNPESSSGEQEEYWLLAIKAARKAVIFARQQDHATQHDRDTGDGR
jgi:hypothetical protein